MRLGPILQAIVAVPALAPAIGWVESALGLVVTGRGRFPRETALTLGSTALVDVPCVAVGLPSAPELLLLVENPAASSSLVPALGWSGLSLSRPGASASVVGLGLHWTLSDGEAALVAATLGSAAPAVTRGYYRGLGAQAPSAIAPERLSLRGAELVIVDAALPSPSAASDVPPALCALVLGRGSATALLPAPDAHSVGPDGEWLLLRAAPIRPLTD